MSLLKNLCSLFIERNFNSPLFSNPYRLSTTCTMYSLLSSLWRFCRYPVWKSREFVCTTLKENKPELCIDLHSKASLAILLPSFARRTFILVVEAVSRYLRLSFVIRKYTTFLHTDVYWFFFCVMILCCVSQMYAKINDLAVKARESSSLFLSTYDNPMRFRNSNYNKDHSMTMKSKSDQTNQIHFLFWSVKCILVLSKSMII